MKKVHMTARENGHWNPLTAMCGRSTLSITKQKKYVTCVHCLNRLKRAPKDDSWEPLKKKTGIFGASGPIGKGKRS